MACPRRAVNETSWEGLYVTSFIIANGPRAQALGGGPEGVLWLWLPARDLLPPLAAKLASCSRKLCHSSLNVSLLPGLMALPGSGK